MLRFVKATRDPELAAGLVEKAADLNERAEAPAVDDVGQAPDAAGGG
ncbi:hypothetical protein [Bradyrhizobium sp. STM 3562]